MRGRPLARPSWALAVNSGGGADGQREERIAAAHRLPPSSPKSRSKRVPRERAAQGSRLASRRWFPSRRPLSRAAFLDPSLDLFRSRAALLSRPGLLELRDDRGPVESPRLDQGSQLLLQGAVVPLRLGLEDTDGFRVHVSDSEICYDSRVLAAGSGRGRKRNGNRISIQAP